MWKYTGKSEHHKIPSKLHFLKMHKFGQLENQGIILDFLYSSPFEMCGRNQRQFVFHKLYWFSVIVFNSLKQ